MVGLVGRWLLVYGRWLLVYGRFGWRVATSVW